MAEEKSVVLSGNQIMTAFAQEKMRLEETNRGINSVQAILEEILFAKESLNAIKKTKKGEKAMVSLGAGVYLDVLVDKSTKVKSSRAGGVIIEKETSAAIEEIEQREKETIEKLEQLEKVQRASYANLNALGQMITQAEKSFKK
ncbi:MAG: hypothetical protein ABH986_00625 [archaeon]